MRTKHKEVINTKLLALDQSTVATGYAIFEDDQYVGCGLIDYRKDKRSAEAHIDAMQDSIQRLITELRPDHVALEDVVLQRSVKTLKDLAQLKGVIIGICKNNGIPFTVLYPAQWRKQLDFKQGGGVKRSQLKAQAATYAYDTYGVNATEDECDAICIGSAALKLNQ